jgi:hypothetical protein
MMISHMNQIVTLKMETARSSERSEQTYYPTRFNDSGGYRLGNTRRKTQKTYIISHVVARKCSI